MIYYVERQMITIRDWPGEHPQPTPEEIFSFPDLDAALRAYCDYILEGYERVRVRGNYHPDGCCHVAVYNRTMDELT